MQEATQAPHVACLIIELALNDLRRDVARCSNSEVRFVHCAGKLDGASKVSDAHTSFRREVAHQDVLNFDVTMHNSALMQVLKRIHHLSDNFLGVHFRKGLNWLFLEIVKQVTCWHEFCYNVVVLSILIRIDHLDDIAHLSLGALT